VADSHNRGKTVPRRGGISASGVVTGNILMNIIRSAEGQSLGFELTARPSQVPFS